MILWASRHHIISSFLEISFIFYKELLLFNFYKTETEEFFCTVFYFLLKGSS